MSTGPIRRLDLGRNVMEGSVVHKPTGRRIPYLVKQSWDRLYYSTDDGRTWHKSKTAALLAAVDPAK